MRRTFTAFLVLVVVPACGGRPRVARVPAPRATPSGRAGRPAAPPSRLALLATRRLPFAVQLPAAAVRGSQVFTAGGLDADDASLATLVRIAPGRPRTVSTLPQAIHDAGAATLRSTVYVFGGGTAAGPTDAIVAIRRGLARTIGHLPQPASDLEAVTVGHRIVVIGGYTATTPLRDVLAFTTSGHVQRIAMLPHALRYAAAAAVGGRVLIAGGTDGVHARSEILSVDPDSGRVRLIGHLPRPLAHAAGAALAGTFYVFGGRGDSLTSQRRAIYAIDPATGRIRIAGGLPVALSDLTAVATGGRLLVIGGRDTTGRVHDRLLEYAPR